MGARQAHDLRRATWRFPSTPTGTAWCSCLLATMAICAIHADGGSVGRQDRCSGMDLLVRLDQLRFLGRGAESPLVTQVTPVTRVVSVLMLCPGPRAGSGHLANAGPAGRQSPAEGYPVPAEWCLST